MMKTLHVDGNINPVRDAETIETELLLVDIETLERRHKKTEKAARSNDKNIIAELELIEKLIEHCSNGNQSRSFNLENEKLISVFKSFHLLTNKPILYVANVSEEEINEKENKYVNDLFNFAKRQGNNGIQICGSIEQEIAKLPDDEKPLFLEEYNLKEPGLNKVIKSGFNLLGLQTFFTCGKKRSSSMDN